MSVQGSWRTLFTKGTFNLLRDLEVRDVETSHGPFINRLRPLLVDHLLEAQGLHNQIGHLLQCFVPNDQEKRMVSASLV